MQLLDPGSKTRLVRLRTCGRKSKVKGFEKKLLVENIKKITNTAINNWHH
jgi:hypothetical protein